MGKLKIPGINSDWRRALVLDPQYQMGIEFGDDSLKKGLPNSPTSYVEKVIPAESALHPHSSLLVEEEAAKRREARRKEKEEEWERIRQSIADSSYKPLSATRNMSKGGRTRPIDGCAIKGKTKPVMF